MGTHTFSAFSIVLCCIVAWPSSRTGAAAGDGQPDGLLIDRGVARATIVIPAKPDPAGAGSSCSGTLA